MNRNSTLQMIHVMINDTDTFYHGDVIYSILLQTLKDLDTKANVRHHKIKSGDEEIEFLDFLCAFWSAIQDNIDIIVVPLTILGFQI